MTRKPQIYFVATEDGSLVKIGFSSHLSMRVTSIKQASPVPVKLLCSVDGTPEGERALHFRFLHLHAHNEWFRAAPEIDALVAHVAARQSLPDDLRGAPGQRDPLRQRGNRRPRTPEERATQSRMMRCFHARKQASA